jgi:hypothetical protein
MLRKTTLALLAAAGLAAAAFAPTSASAAWGWHGGGGWRGGWHHGWGGPRVVLGAVPYYGPACVVRRWAPTPWGPRLRLVTVC